MTQEKDKKKITEYTAQDLEDRFQDLTACAVCRCTLLTDCVGGVPADDQGVKNFVQYQMGLTGVEAEEAAARIMKEEIGESAVKALKPNGEPDETAELKEREVYGINVVRRDEHGPWLGNWMVKACLKAAASRTGLFIKKKGSKGDLSEMGRVLANGASLRNVLKPERIYPFGGDTPLAGVLATRYEKFMGRVSTSQGSKSIVHWSEVIPAGANFEFEFRFGGDRATQEEIVGLFAIAGNIGLGSVKALERGKFQIDTLRLEK